VIDEFVNLRGRPVKDCNFEPMIVHVEHKVLAHNSQTDQTYIASSFRHSMFSTMIPRRKGRGD
jgi:hypothetical protein